MATSGQVTHSQAAEEVLVADPEIAQETLNEVRLGE